MARPSRTHDEIAASRLRLALHGQAIVARDGAAGLTMRALAAQADCSLGFTYRVFEDRNDLVREILALDIPRLVEIDRALAQRVAANSVVENLQWAAVALADSPAVSLAPEVATTPMLAKFIDDTFKGRGLSATQILTRYLTAEHAAGRTRHDIDPLVIAQVIAAVARDHGVAVNVRADRDERYRAMITAIAALL